MREVIRHLEKAPERRMSRAGLERELVDDKGFDSSNLLRAIKSLRRTNDVSLLDRHRKADAIVELPKKPRPMTDEEIVELLTQITNEEEKT